MTKNDLQKELKEKAKEGIKPSDIKRLKRSKSLNDIASAPNSELISLQTENQELKKRIQELEKAQKDQEIFVDCPEDNPAELKTQISQLEDQILELRISKLKDFGDYWEKNKELKKDLESNIDYEVKEIERLENKLKTINRKKLELEQKLGEAQSKNAKLEIKLISAENKEAQTAAPHSDF
ncbi:2433_t:CDS:1 [Cetraspora pellucida]|uniref:2433_t:CDS:1 n=1 Tax=Cetraspora pellucida TaxID=1433469 RepID=A0ACA9NH23_9GLOM|nr:2433_t:CDS:1 [Cetraspora pellucida]